jgi:competence protein ComEA
VSTPRPAPAEETRAEVARRRLAQLAASFEATHGEDPFDRLRGGADPDVDERRVDRDAPGPAAAGHEPTGRGRRRAAPPRRTPRIGGAHLRVVATAAVAAGVLLTWWLLAERPRTADVDRPLSVSARADTSPGPAAQQGGATGQVVVDVAGQVERPGIVTLPAGSRVFEAVEKAGGIVGELEEPTLNLARVLVDGEQILVGVEAADPAAVGGTPAGGAGGTGGAVDLNSATLEQLDALPGVGPVTAQAILDWRAENGRFAAVEDLLDVSGIGEKTLEDLRDLVRV